MFCAKKVTFLLYLFFCFRFDAFHVKIKNERVCIKWIDEKILNGLINHVSVPHALTYFMTQRYKILDDYTHNGRWIVDNDQKMFV